MHRIFFVIRNKEYYTRVRFRLDEPINKVLLVVHSSIMIYFSFASDQFKPFIDFNQWLYLGFWESTSAIIHTIVKSDLKKYWITPKKNQFQSSIYQQTLNRSDPIYLKLKTQFMLLFWLSAIVEQMHEFTFFKNKSRFDVLYL